MRKSFLKKIIAISIATTSVAGINEKCVSAAWLKDENNNWSWKTEKDKAIGWKQIETKWYYFDEKGVMKTGWIALNGNWYHLSDSGSMDTGWTKVDGQWYSLSNDGVMNTGWINDNGIWYYANLDGTMQTGSISIDGEVYNFDKNGVLIENKTTQEDSKNENSEQNINQTTNNTESNDDSTQNKKGYVNTNNESLNVRSDSSTDGEIIGTLEKGTEIEIVDFERNEFYPITYNNGQAWVSSEWISFEKPENKDNISNSDEVTKDDKELDQNNDEDLSLLHNIRTEEPDLDDYHYYSDDNIFYKAKLSPPFPNSSGGKIQGNCTWYAWGRIWEYTGKKPTEAGFTGNAYEWWEANKRSGKYQYGSEPKAGAIGVWKSSLPGSGGFGHVAFIEKVEDGKIYISESMWHGSCFKYQEIYSTNHMYGYIYLDKPNY